MVRQKGSVFVVDEVGSLKGRLTHHHHHHHLESIHLFRPHDIVLSIKPSSSVTILDISRSRQKFPHNTSHQHLKSIMPGFYTRKLSSTQRIRQLGSMSRTSSSSTTSSFRSGQSSRSVKGRRYSNERSSSRRGSQSNTPSSLPSSVATETSSTTDEFQDSSAWGHFVDINPV